MAKPITYSVRVSPETSDAIKQVAKECEVSISDVIKHACKRYLRDYKPGSLIVEERARK